MPTIDMALSGSGIRDTARVLKISPTTVINELKKGATLSNVNHRLLAWFDMAKNRSETGSSPY